MSAELLSSLASTEGDWHSPFREDSSKSKDDKEREKKCNAHSDIQRSLM